MSNVKDRLESVLAHKEARYTRLSVHTEAQVKHQTKGNKGAQSWFPTTRMIRHIHFACDAGTDSNAELENSISFIREIHSNKITFAQHTWIPTVSAIIPGHCRIHAGTRQCKGSGGLGKVAWNSHSVVLDTNYLVLWGSVWHAHWGWKAEKRQAADFTDSYNLGIQNTIQ